MSRGYLVSLREQDFNSVGGQPLHHDSLLVASEEAADTKTSVVHGHGTPPATCEPGGGDTNDSL